MQARVIAVGAVRGVGELTYLVAPELEDRIEPGHRVLAPLGSRKVTGVVVETGERLADADRRLKPILEVLEPRPLFDRAHLQMMEFLANYYMAPLADVYRSVIPAVARVESQVVYRIVRPPDPLRRAAFTATETKLVEALLKRPMTSRQMRRLGDDDREFCSVLDALVAEGLVEARGSTRGRHRETAQIIARLANGLSPPAVRGRRQREVVEIITRAASGGVDVAELKAQLPGSSLALKVLERRGIVTLEAAATHRYTAPAPPAVPSYELAPEQRAAIAAVAPAIENQEFQTFLLFGVTGSGKTEVYLQLAAKALEAGRQVIVLVPEIALADELVRSFRARFGAMVGVAHSAQSVSERWESWMAALTDRTRIMIGPRSLIFAPIHGAGLIVVDEEHDPAYKSEEGIRYHARDLAVALGRFARCPVVLGSATPSAESFANARRGRYRLLRLPRRVNDRPMATVEVVDLRRETPRPTVTGNGKSNSNPDLVPLSQTLITALGENLASGGQSMVFLNRRGYHNFLQCHLCGNVVACPNCSVSMTFHLRDRSIRCHYCGNRTNAPDQCPECGALDLHGQGFGTERLQSALAELMPKARIERLDSDTGGRKGVRAGILASFRAGKIDILVGTQMITKGFDFPGVTLAAVVTADIGLNLPDFRSAERTFQLLTQVAGRAGRGERPGRVIIQTWAPHHYSIRAARDQDYARFIRRELELRRELSYPPYARLAIVRIEGENERAVARLAAEAAEVLKRAAQTSPAASSNAVSILGPAPAPIERIKRRFRWQVMVKSVDLSAMRTALAALRTELAERARRADVYLALDIDPARML